MEHNDLSQFNDKTVLVFGGDGFIGSNFIRAIFNASPQVRIFNCDARTYSGNPNNLTDVRAKYQSAENDTGQFVEMHGDISNPDHVAQAFLCNPDFVINFAAETHVDRSIHVGSKQFVDTNVTGVYNILEAITRRMAEGKMITKYVQVSTDEVYGMLENPYDTLKRAHECDGTGCEDKLTTLHYHLGGLVVDRKQLFDYVNEKKFTRESQFSPNVPYSATKAGGDCLCNAYRHTFHVPVCVTHCSNNYGPYQYPEKLVPFWASRVIKGEKIPIYGDGLNIRDWIHVDDHITALGAVLLRGVPGDDYLIGADNERTNMEMARIIVDYVQRDIKGEYAPDFEDHIEYVVDRPGHDRRYAIDHSAITKELGWTPKYGHDEFYAKIKETIQWYADHPEWVNEVIERTGVANPHIDLWKAHKLDEDKTGIGGGIA